MLQCFEYFCCITENKEWTLSADGPRLPWAGSCCSRRVCVKYRMAQKNWHNVFYALTLRNINRFSKFFHRQNQEKICNNIITRDPTTPQLCCYTTLCPTKAPRCGVLPSRLFKTFYLLFKTFYLYIWCKNCMMWQLL